MKFAFIVGLLSGLLSGYEVANILCVAETGLGMNCLGKAYKWQMRIADEQRQRAEWWRSRADWWVTQYINARKNGSETK